MTYQEVIDYLYNQLPVFQQAGRKAFKPGLERIAGLCQRLDHPERSFPVIHVAGTNGKGSTCHYLNSILQESGYTVGLHTSPHIKDLRERFTVNGQWVNEDFVIQFVEKVQPWIQELQPTFFELTVAMAFEHFKQQKVDVAIIETGMGGRLDSTNIVDPIVCVITRIGLDHTEYLGDTLSLIAQEKGGIIKASKPVVLGKNLEEVRTVIASITAQLKSPLFEANEAALLGLNLGQLPTYQKENLAVVLRTIGVLRNADWRIPSTAIQLGIDHVAKNSGLVGRWQIIEGPVPVIYDTGHNANALEHLSTNLSHLKYNQLHIVWGMVDDKDHKAVIALLPKTATYFFCAPNLPRGLPANQLLEMAAEMGLKGQAYTSTQAALAAAKVISNKGDLILVGGSTFVVAELLPE